MASNTTSQGAEWHWQENPRVPPLHRERMDFTSMPGAFQEDATPPDDSPPKSQRPQEPKKAQQQRSQRTWPPRTCRICLETVLPTIHPPSDSVPNILQPSPSVSYISEDPAAGRLLRPCKCKGSSKYVHEGCLQAWRHADPGYGKRNYWQCPTCGFRYRLERMKLGRAISSTMTQIVLTASILLLAMFLLGFVADPIINFYLDPYSTLSRAPLSKLGTKLEPILTDEDEASWTEHFLKGLASLGLLSFVKVLLALSPWQWWNLRSSGILSGGGRTGGNGRERLASISWLVVLIGVGTFLWGVYKGVRAWSRRTLEKASERVTDVPMADEDEADDD
ncbi:MAG: hypothetical protein Q9187_000168 [Circinaria calcarea]